MEPDIPFPRHSMVKFDSRIWEVLAVNFDRRDLIGPKNERLRLNIHIDKLEPLCKPGTTSSMKE